MFKQLTIRQMRILAVIAIIDLLLGILAAWVYFRPAEAAEAALPRRTAETVELKVIPQPTPIPVPFPGQEAGTDESPVPAASPADVPAATGSPSRIDVFFTLKIGKETVSVARGVGEETLLEHPGWLETSAAPGKEGVCIVYGHRNRNHLKALKNVTYGDKILLTMKDGTEYAYVVESIEILDSETDLHIPLVSGKHLLLTTCYPFYYTGHAPKKYIVTAVCA